MITLNKRKKLIINNFLLLLIGISSIIFFNFSNQSPSLINRDRIFADLNYLSYNAKTYYSRTKKSSDFRNSFYGWELPDEFKHKDYAKYTVTVEKNKIKIEAIGVETGLDSKNPVKVDGTLTYTGIFLDLIN